MSLTTLLVPTFTQMLRGLSAWLDKAAAQEQAGGRSADALLSLRLAGDMYPLGGQVRFACFQAQEPLYRLSGRALPDELQILRAEGWGSGEQPGSLAEAQARIGEALATLGALAPDALAPNALDQGNDLPIALELPNGMVFDMTGEQYARDWALPQFSFHLTMAYAILRHHGAALGKADYVAHMLKYLRRTS